MSIFDATGSDLALLTATSGWPANASAVRGRAAKMSPARRWTLNKPERPPPAADP
ncbi:MAG: hypothetical protein MZU79_04630 [Anaerotruncus sp.]|nr:hypothetical protein [Anaerotruncus sp.]